jgi:hypothetical protein
MTFDIVVFDNVEIGNMMVDIVVFDNVEVDEINIAPSKT